MQSQKSQAQRCLETILRDEQPSINSTLVDYLPEPYFTSRSEQIKRNISDFIQNCLKNKKLVQEMIDRGIKSKSFHSEYQKNLALFSVEMLSGQYGDSYKMFIQRSQNGQQLNRSKTLKNQSEIEQQIEVDPTSEEDQFNKKYSSFMYLLEYIRQPEGNIQEINMSYFTKIITNIITNRVEEVYAYFQHNHHLKHNSAHQNEQPNSSLEEKSDLQYLLSHAYNFGGVSEVLGKMVAQEGPANKYIEVKKRIIEIVLQMLKSEDLIKQNSCQYHYLIDFVSYLLSRTKYRSDDHTEQIGKITQRFVDQNVIWFFKEKLVKAVIDSNGLITSGFMNSSGNLNRSESSKSARKQYELKPENEQQFRKQETIFENAIGFLQIIVERINYEEEIDKFESEEDKPPQPTMDFQVDQVLFGQNSLYELFTLNIPTIYKSINKMSYYELLLKLTRNSRYKNPNPLHEMGILPSFVAPILIHLLKIFRRESRRNGLVNFYVQELICQAILPKAQKFQTKQAMMILSALDPSEEIINKIDDTRAFTKKLLICMKSKCQWFEEHFMKLGLNLKQIKQNYKVKLAGNCAALSNRKNQIKQFQFLYGDDNQKNQIKSSNRIQRSERFQDEGPSSSSDSEKDLKQFDTRRQFSYPDETNKQKKQQNDDADLQQNLFRSSDNQIMQQIRISGSEVNAESSLPRLEQQRKQSQIELLVESAGEEDQVIREDMKPEIENPPC